jgi:predicted alpha/beta-hydrolase family hydrolase
MTSQAQATSPLPGVVGLAFLGFPLHPPSKSGVERAAHLADVQVPMLFMQGARDEFAQPALLQATVDSLGDRATLLVIPDGDHSFAVRKASGLTPVMVKEQLCDALVAWLPNT